MTQNNEALQALDTMLDEISARWRKNHSKIYQPTGNDQFKVYDDNGLPYLVPTGELRFADVVQHLAKRYTAHNPGLAMYTEGALVPVDHRGALVETKEVVQALNDKLLLFVSPSPKHSAMLGRIAVACA
jgi:hypothetical protein